MSDTGVNFSLEVWLGNLRTNSRTRHAGATLKSSSEWRWSARGDNLRRTHTAGSQTKTTDYLYDANGNRYQEDRISTDSGTVERDSYAFNARDQLVRWVSRETVGRQSNSRYVDYELRGDGSQYRRTKGTVNASGADVPSSRIDYCYVRECDPAVSHGTGERLWSTVSKDLQTGATTKARYGYDDLGSVTRIVFDATGAVLPPTGANPADGPAVCGDSAAANNNETTYCYDEFARLTFSKGQGIDRSERFAYDGLDRRDSKTTFTVEGQGAPRRLSYVGTSEQLSREIKGDGGKQLYDYNSRGTRLGQDKVTGAASSYAGYDLDAQGSVVGIEADNGTVPASQEYDYDPYGELETPDGDDKALGQVLKDNPFRYQGFYFDSGIKTYDMHARSYRPEIGRFLSEDIFADAAGDQTLQADPLTQNRYAFTGGNPVTLVEFDGHTIPTSPDGGRVSDGQKLRDGTVAKDGVPLGQGPVYDPQRYAASQRYAREQRDAAARSDVAAAPPPVARLDDGAFLRSLPRGPNGSIDTSQITSDQHNRLAQISQKNNPTEKSGFSLSPAVLLGGCAASNIFIAEQACGIGDAVRSGISGDLPGVGLSLAGLVPGFGTGADVAKVGRATKPAAGIVDDVVAPVVGGSRRIQALRNIGEEGAGQAVREVPGGLSRAEEIYTGLARGAQPFRTLPDGRQLLQRTDGTIIGLRSTSKSGPPSIDVRPPGGSDQYFQLHFPGG